MRGIDTDDKTNFNNVHHIGGSLFIWDTYSEY